MSAYVQAGWQEQRDDVAPDDDDDGDDGSRIAKDVLEKFRLDKAEAPEQCYEPERLKFSVRDQVSDSRDCGAKLWAEEGNPPVFK